MKGVMRGAQAINGGEQAVRAFFGVKCLAGRHDDS